MTVNTIHIEGVKIIEPTVFGDDRGYFMESYNQEKLKLAGIDLEFIQDNEAFSSHGVLRGLHYQTGNHAQAKLVRVIHGEVLDVIVDVRPDSLTYGQSYSIKLSGDNKKQLLVPRGMAHGYVVLSDTATFAYKCDNHYHKASEGGIKYDDPNLGIDWILAKEVLQLSQKDKALPTLGNHIPFL